MNFGAHGFLWTLAFVWCKQTQIFKYLLCPFAHAQLELGFFARPSLPGCWKASGQGCAKEHQEVMRAM